MLHEIGIETGVDLPALIACTRPLQRHLGRAARQPHAGRRPGRLAALMFDAVLIANRGEIARRVIRTLARSGSARSPSSRAADRHAPHVREADEAVRVASYLDLEALIDGLRARAAPRRCIPGYGFLSENPALAAGVRRGRGRVRRPAARGQRADGRQAARQARPRRRPACPSCRAITGGGRRAGASYPLLVKAAAGGGGRGMRVVESPTDLDRGAGVGAARGRGGIRR